MIIKVTKFFHGVESGNLAWEKDTEHTVSDKIGQDLIDRGRAVEVVPKKTRAAEAAAKVTAAKKAKGVEAKK